MTSKYVLNNDRVGLVVALCVLVISMTFQTAEATCHPTVHVENKKIAHPPPLNITSLAPDVREAAELQTHTVNFWYTIPRGISVKYCKDYHEAESKKQQILEIRGMSHPKSTSLIYMTSSNKACKSYDRINSKTLIQQTTVVVDRGKKAIVNCPGGDTVCYVYKLVVAAKNGHHRRLKTSTDASARKLLQGSQCIVTDGTCGSDVQCCSSWCSNGNCKCHQDGTACTDDAYCCSINCQGGVCKEEGSDCFPGDATVELADGRAIRFADLHLGDHIKVVSSSGEIKVEPALFWLHRNPNKYSLYWNIHTVHAETGVSSTLRLTKNHFLPVSKDAETPLFDKSFMAPAKDVQEGWWIWVKSSDDASTMSPARVTSVTRELLRGQYMVMTDRGTLVVDGVAASSYADIKLPDGSLMCESFMPTKNIPAFHHAALAPLRLAAKVLGPKAMEELASSKFCPDGSFTVPWGRAMGNTISWMKGI